MDLELNQFDFQNKGPCCYKAVTQTILEISYDIFTVIVSLLDVITDIIVLIDFYQSDRMPFFYTSLTILIIAQLAYTMAFWWKFIDASYETACSALFACCCLLSLSPILSYAFYFTSNQDTPLYKFFHRLFHFECGYDFCVTSKNKKNKVNDQTQALRQWVEDKLMKHLGFIIEALIEAFPQSILQLIAIVYYNDSHNYVSILSILLSMLSVSTKSFILSVKISYNWKSALFNWVSCLIDFIAIFCVVSFIFYVPPYTIQNSNPFETLQQIWMYGTLVTVIPFSFIGSIVLMVLVISDESDKCNFDFCVLLFLVFILWIVGLCLTAMLMTIAGFAVFALILIYTASSRRFGKALDTAFFMPLIYFVSSAKSVTVNDYYEEESPLKISQKQHKIIRICCINRGLLDITDSWYHEPELHNYLKQQSVTKNYGDVPYINATLKDIKSHSRNANSNKITTCKKLLDSYKKVPQLFYDKFSSLDKYNICSLFVLYCCLPLYFIGRCFNVVFTFFMIGYLYIGYDINVFTNDIPSFQTTMISCYLCLIALWIILLFFVCKEQYYLSFILPSTNKLTSSTNQEDNTRKTKQIMNYYHSVVSQLVAQRYCIKLFGKDVTMIIMDLCGNGDYVLHKDVV